MFLTWKSLHLFPHVKQSERMEMLVGSVLESGVATVEWTHAAIYHLSLSTCVGGPAAGIIAIWKQLTVILPFCLCESSSSPCMPRGTSSLEMTPRAGTEKSESVVDLNEYHQLHFQFSWWSRESEGTPTHSLRDTKQK